MKSFKEVVNEGKGVTFANTIGNRKEKGTNYTAEVIFKSFVDQATAIEMFKALGITAEFTFYKGQGGDSIAKFSDASGIKPKQISDLKMDSFVKSAKRFKV